MAEIRIKKKSGPVWPWVIGLLILLAAIWFFVEFALTEEGIKFQGKIEEPFSFDKESEMYPTHTRNIDQFIALVNDEIFLQENIDEEKAKEGMQLLSNALDEVIEERKIVAEDVIVDKHVLSKQVNNYIWKGKSTGDGDINRSFSTAANLLGGIQKEQFPGLEKEVAEVKASALSIVPTEEISDQGEQVKEFLVKSGHTLQLMRDGMYDELYEEVSRFDEEVRLIKQSNK